MENEALLLGIDVGSTTVKIAVLEGGRLIEEGTHRELMERNGKYANLFRIQAERYLESEQIENPS